VRTNGTSSERKLGDLLKPDRLKLPDRPRLAAIHAREVIDWTGESALDIFLEFPNATSAKDFAVERVEPIKDRIRTVLHEHQEDRAIYFTIGTAEDYRERYSAVGDD